MKKIFITSILFTAISVLDGCVGNTGSTGNATADVRSKEIYEWRIYSLNDDGNALDDFFKTTLIPAYNRKGVSVGAFTSYKEEEVKLRYLLFVYRDIASFHKIKKEIWQDTVFGKAAQPFFDATAPNPVYSNFETFLCEAFDKIPQMRIPDKSRTLFELRTYHSPNEEANQRKIKMFNVDEIDIFDKTGINSVCYGEVLAGSRMPALIYLTWYKDETTRNEAWSAFVGHQDWARIKDMPEYAYTATNNRSKLLSPLPYSQF
ncbi:MAG: NIPSNAP family protein [Prevotellaceae bacterium]|jgi:hypothetical protein|nr:NIPSNAP family protein [Prevotellaceae bacterium]